ncbi:hypothetical protein TA3x_002592 [Tundrisphaera sp. TA3]|uniref:hypothetical protein n=1 Tax=Tundrisphaera sp. TA3 TaxID=3435775 RepID=UPI003EBCC2BC
MTTHRPGSRPFLRMIAALAAMASTVATARAAAPAVEVENVRVGFEERFKPGSWTPVWIQLRGGPQGFAGVMELVAPDEYGTETVVRQPVQVGPGQGQRVTAYVRVGSTDPDFATLRFRDGKTGRRAVNDAAIGSLMGSKVPDALTAEDYLLVALGQPQGIKQIPTLPGFNADRNGPATYGRAREVAVAQPGAAEDLLPGRWYGYDAADAVAIDTNDKETLAALSAGRGEALRRWVERGGHLVVAVGSNWQAVNDSVLGPMLPLRIAGQVQVEPYEAIEAFAGGSKPIVSEANQGRAAKFEEVEARGGQVIASTLSTPLIVRGPYGFGRVTVIGLDVDAKPFADWPDRALFWVKAMDLKAPPGDANAAINQAGRLVQSGVSDLSSRLLQALEQFQGVTLVPFGWVAGFIFLYILLIGPGDYFFLKKVLKRMELTWITFPTIVVAVSLLAYYAAYRIKGTDLRVNKVDIVDVDLATKRVRGSTFFNVFSPQNRDYDVAIAPLAPDRPEPAADAGEVPPPPPGTETMVSWFGAPEAGLRGMNNRGRGTGFGGSGYAYEPAGRAERLEGVRVGIWSTKAFAGRWDGPAPSPVVDSDLSAVGTDRVEGTVTNRLDIPLKNVLLAYGTQVYYQIPTIEPGATVQIDASLNRVLGGYLDDLRASFMPDNFYGQQTAKIDRANLARELMFHDSDRSGKVSLPSRALHDLDLTGQLELGRPMLVAQVDRPAAKLLLGDTPSPAKVEQTTLIRVILPLKPEASRGK